MDYSKENPSRRVVITGLGVISSIGIGWEEFWKNLISGVSGINRISSFDTSFYDCHFAGEVKNFAPEVFLNKRKIHKIGRASQMAIAASKLAIKDADFSLKHLEKTDRVAVCIGTTGGEIGLLEKFNDYRLKFSKEIPKDHLPIFPASSLSANIALEFKMSGPNLVFGTACAAGNFAIAKVFDFIRARKIDYGLAGGADGSSRIVFTGFGRLYDIAPEKCQPFDKNRKGMIPGEGAGVLFLEILESALKRKAHIYAEILGYGLSCDAHTMAYPSVEGIIKAIRRALNESQVQESEIDYISAHGTGTKENDKVECQAYKRVFGKLSTKIPISSIKSMLGHTMGAASAFESIACCLAIDQGEIPPTINFEEKDPECNINCVPNKGRQHKVQIALNNSQAFGGNNACLAFCKLEI